MNIHLPRRRMTMGSLVEFGCADVPAVSWCKISSINVIGCAWSVECCMPGMACMVSFDWEEGLVPCWCCDGCTSCPNSVAENRISEIINKYKNDRFMSDPYQSA